jgi:hypothetical protein
VRPNLHNCANGDLEHDTLELIAPAAEECLLLELTRMFHTARADGVGEFVERPSNATASSQGYATPPSMDNNRSLEKLPEHHAPREQLSSKSVFV